MTDQHTFNAMPPIEEDEITLKELIEKIIVYLKEIRKGFLIVLAIAALMGGYMFYKAYKTAVVFPAKLTFMLNEDTGGGASGVAAILGSFGFGGGGGSSYNLNKILELSKSRNIIEDVLFTQATIDGKNDYYANHIIDKYKLHEKNWAKDTSGLSTFYFKRSSLDSFTRLENTALQSLYGMVLGGEGQPGLFSGSLTKESGIMTFNMVTVSEDLSIGFLNTLFEAISSFYIKKAVQKEQETVNLLKFKVDSVKSVLFGREAGLAHFEDSNLFLQEQTAALPKKRLNRDVQMLTVMYGEAVKNLELAQFALQNKRPFLQAIDRPIPPIKPQRESKLKSLIMGIAIGTVLASVFIILRKIIRDAMAS